MDLLKVEHQLRTAKERLAMVYERKGATDWEVLKVGDQVDRLINVYHRLVKDNNGTI